jgi:ADP-heptose:LPS heptosyltransferase
VSEWHQRGNYAILHPGTAFFTKQWPPANFARAAEFLAGKGLTAIAIDSGDEIRILGEIERETSVPLTAFSELTLPEITALASRASVFVGNDSGIAHIAAAVSTPSVVIFGSSNREHWRPWTDAPNEIVYEEFHCQPCPGYECKEFGDAPCIRSVAPERVFGAIERVLAAADGR